MGWSCWCSATLERLTCALAVPGWASLVACADGSSSSSRSSVARPDLLLASLDQPTSSPRPHSAPCVSLSLQLEPHLQPCRFRQQDRRLPCHLAGCQEREPFRSMKSLIGLRDRQVGFLEWWITLHLQLALPEAVPSSICRHSKLWHAFFRLYSFMRSM